MIVDTMHKGTYYLSSKHAKGGGFSSVGTRTGAIKLAMANTWWHQFPPLLAY